MKFLSLRHHPCFWQGVSHSTRTEAHAKNRRARQPRTTGHAVRSLDEVALILGLSRQRVHEIESRAFQKLREALAEEVPSLEPHRHGNGF